MVAAGYFPGLRFVFRCADPDCIGQVGTLRTVPGVPRPFLEAVAATASSATASSAAAASSATVRALYTAAAFIGDRVSVKGG